MNSESQRLRDSEFGKAPSLTLPARGREFGITNK